MTLYPTKDLEGQSKHWSFRGPQSNYDELSDLYDELTRTQKADYGSFSDVPREAMVRQVQFMRDKLEGSGNGGGGGNGNGGGGGRDIPSPTANLELLRKMNRVYQMDLAVKGELQRARENIREVEKQLGREGAQEMVVELLRVVDRMTVTGLRDQALEYIEQEFAAYLVGMEKGAGNGRGK